MVSPMSGQSSPAAQRPKVAMIDIPEGNHQKQVKETLIGSGVPEGDIVSRTLTRKTVDTRNSPTAQEALETWVKRDYDEVSDQLDAFLQDPASKDVKVLNLSIGSSRITLYDTLLKRAQTDPAFKAKLLKELPTSAGQNDEELLQNIIYYVDDNLDNNLKIQDSKLRYDRLIARAADQGIHVVAAAGNDQEILQTLRKKGFDLRDDAGFNLLAQHDNITRVGALDDRGTPKNKADDRPAAFSSAASSSFPVTLAANGVDVHGDPDKDGTSFAAPQVTAGIQELLIANPNLTIEQQRAILKSSAHNNPKIPDEIEGAGMLNQKVAVAKAKQQAATPPAAPKK